MTVWETTGDHKSNGRPRETTGSETGDHGRPRETTGGETGATGSTGDKEPTITKQAKNDTGDHGRPREAKPRESRVRAARIQTLGLRRIIEDP